MKKTVRRSGGQTVSAIVAAGLLTVWPFDRLTAWQCPNGMPPPCGRSTTAGPNSVAVLLFTNVARDSAYAYLADGLASEISTTLAGVPRLEVRSPGFVRRLSRDADPDPRVIGRRLGVRYVVEGDYQRGGDRIRVSVRLVLVATGTQRWSNAYARPMNDLLAVQEDVAREVATSIAGQLLPQERTAIAAHPTRNPEAWDHFLRGNFLLARRTRDGVARAMEEYAEAVRLDPAFTAAEARIALGHALFLDWGWPSRWSREELISRGLAAADHAIARDSASADGWMARGSILAFRSPSDYTDVLPNFARAIALDPGNAEALHQYGSKLYELGDWEASVALERRSLAADPDRPVSQMQMGKALGRLGRDDEALRAFDSSLTLDTAFAASANFAERIAFSRGDTASACRYAELAGHGGTPEWSLPAIAACQAARGDSASARRSMALAMAPFDSLLAVPIYAAVTIAWAMLRTGRRDAAVAWLERAAPRGEILWTELLSSALSPLASDPRFQQLVRANRPIGAKCCPL